MPNSESRNAAPPPLTRNTVSLVGWVLTSIVGALLLILVGADILFHKQEPYNSLVTYLILPWFLVGGVLIVVAGALLEWRRRHKRAPGEYPPQPVIDFNLPWQRRRVVVAFALLAFFLGFSAVGTYRSYLFTESPVFCGQVCHQVMRPEYTAYQHSPHARVSCAECHIGSGADWYVKSKLSGLRQVWAVLTHSYHLPIPTPVRDLRPARETCEECHWPEKFSDSMEKVVWHFAPNEANTASRLNLLLRVGGGSPEKGQGKGIHWHIARSVQLRYWARDPARGDIPWVEARIGAEPPRVYRAPDCPPGPPAEAEIRVMDCIDCHNRPSHIYHSPLQLIDTALAAGLLDASLPYLKRYAMQIYERSYPDTPAALTAIEETVKKNYASWARGPEAQARLSKNVRWLQDLYQQNFFPEQDVSWRVYPNHQGHFQFPGCYRCHDEKHRAEDGKTISNDCELCHQILDQAEGDAAYGPLAYHGGPYRHPLNMGDIWKTGNCTDCHGLNPAPASRSTAGR